MKSQEHIPKELMSAQSEGISLSRSSGGKYYWRITLLSLDVGKLEELNSLMLDKFKEKGEDSKK